MTEPRNFEKIDQKLSAAMQVPTPSPEFVSGLWTRIENQPPRPKSRSAVFPSLRRTRGWAFAAVSFIVFLTSFMAIGPSRVIAALKAFLNYIPGIGYVDDNSAMRIVKPHEQTVEGVTFSILAGVVDGQKTVLRYTYTGIALPTPGSEGPLDLCMLGPHVLLPDGSELSGSEGMTGTEDHVIVDGYQTYASIPQDVNSFDLVFPCLMYAEKILSPENIVLHLQLEPMPPDYPAYQVIELPKPTATSAFAATEAPNMEGGRSSSEINSIQFAVDRMAETPDGFLFEGSLSWPTNTFNFVNLWTFDIQVTDANGREVEFQEATEQGLAAYTEGKLGWAVRTNRKNYAFPLTFHLPVVNVSQSRKASAFQIDLGDHPSVGQAWELNYQYNLEDLPITVHRATLIKQPGGSSDNLYLNIEGVSPIGNDASLSFKLDDSSMFPSCETLNGVGGGGGGGGMDSSGNGGSFSTLIFLGCQPHGEVTVLLDSVSFDLKGNWSAIVDLPVTGQGTKIP